MFLRRLRGLLATTLGGTLVGGIAGTLLALVALFVPGPTTVTPHFFGSSIIVPAFLGAVLGALSGATFGLLLMVAERGRRIAELRASRVALWAALASAVAVRLTGTSWSLVVIGSGIGAGVGATATLLAKRAADRDADRSMAEEGISAAST
jgi:hypothetical protein